MLVYECAHILLFTIYWSDTSLTTDCANQLRSSRTEYDSDTNPNIWQFVAIRGVE